MDDELKRTHDFADLVERRTGIRLTDADARALHLRLLTLYRLLIRALPENDLCPAGRKAPARAVHAVDGSD